jgi:hypothetical protein
MLEPVAFPLVGRPTLYDVALRSLSPTHYECVALPTELSGRCCYFVSYVTL